MEVAFKKYLVRKRLTLSADTPATSSKFIPSNYVIRWEPSSATLHQSGPWKYTGARPRFDSNSLLRISKHTIVYRHGTNRIFSPYIWENLDLTKIYFAAISCALHRFIHSLIKLTNPNLLTYDLKEHTHYFS